MATQLDQKLIMGMYKLREWKNAEPSAYQERIAYYSMIFEVSSDFAAIYLWLVHCKVDLKPSTGMRMKTIIADWSPSYNQHLDAYNIYKKYKDAL